MTAADPFGEIRSHFCQIDDIFDGDKLTLAGVSSTSSCCSKFDANSVELRHVISQEEVVGSGAPLEMVVLTDSEVATGTPNITARPNFEIITKSRKVKNRIGDNYYCAGIFLKSLNII